MDILNVRLPYPPSINHYYVHTAKGMCIGRHGKKFRTDVCFLMSRHAGKFSDTDRLSLVIEVYPPDKRRRDLDNVLKALIDAIQHAKVFPDDSQIDSLRVYRREPVQHGRVDVCIDTCY